MLINTTNNSNRSFHSIFSTKNKSTIKNNNKLTFQEFQLNLLNYLNSPNHSISNQNIFYKLKDDSSRYNSYKDFISTTMTKYDNNTNEKEKNEFITTNDKFNLSNLKNINKSFYSHNNNYPITIHSQRKFHNPFQSLMIIKNNKKIYEIISKNFLKRQNTLYNESIKNQPLNKKIKSLKIKVTNKPQKFFNIPIIEKKKKNVEIEFIPTGCLKLFCYYRYPIINFPEGREQFGFNLKENEIILSGGLSSDNKNFTLWKLKVETLKWKKIPISKNNIQLNRYGHSVNLFDNKLFIFGGFSKLNKSNVKNDFIIFNLSDNSFSSPKIIGKEPICTKNHISLLIGTQIFIYGGITEQNEIINDCNILNLNPLKWLKPKIDELTPPPFLYGHSACLVIQSKILQDSSLNVYKIPIKNQIINVDEENSNNNDNNNKYKNTRLKEMGIYVFGGKIFDPYLNKTNNSNQLWICIIGKKPLQWVQPECKGKPPSPRLYCSMNFYENGNYLIIHGGKDENNIFGALNDTFILDLEFFEWKRIELYGNNDNFKIIRRCGHNSCIYMNKLIIFGGMNNKNYIGSSIFIINLDFYYNMNIKSGDEVLMDALKSKNDEESQKQLQTLRENYKNNQLGIVKDVKLPPIE
jgi:hypothetical protein